MVDSSSAPPPSRSHSATESPAPTAHSNSSTQPDTVTAHPSQNPAAVANAALVQRAFEEDASGQEDDELMAEDADVDADAFSLTASAPSVDAGQSTSARVDKGKRPQRDEAPPSLSVEEQDKVDEAERQKIVEKVLKRAETARVSADVGCRWFTLAHEHLRTRRWGGEKAAGASGGYRAFLVHFTDRSIRADHAQLHEPSGPRLVQG